MCSGPAQTDVEQGLCLPGGFVRYQHNRIGFEALEAVDGLGDYALAPSRNELLVPDATLTKHIHDLATRRQDDDLLGPQSFFDQQAVQR